MKPLLYRCLLSGFIVFHLITILILPNSDSILSRQISPWLAPYANTFGLNTSWRFFSPEPSPAVYFIYDAIDEQKIKNFWHEREFVTGSWPPLTPKGMWTENIKRLVYHSRFTTSSQERTEVFFGSLLCRFYPEAGTISVRTIIKEIPSLEKAKFENLTAKESVKDQTINQTEFTCAK